MIQFNNTIKHYGKLILDDLPHGCWIAGGSLRNYFTGLSSTASDIDIFFENQQTFDVVLEYMKNTLEGVVKYENERVTRIVVDKYKRFDLVKHLYPEGPQSCIDSFDFTVSMLAVDKTKFYHGETTFIDLSKRQIMLNEYCKNQHPLSTLARVIKYVKKGYHICNEEISKLYTIINSSEQEANQQIIGQYPSFIGID